MTVSARLGDHLSLAARTPFDWASHNCGLWVADWLVALGWPDPADGLRGRASTVEEWAQLLDQRSGFVATTALRAHRIGLKRTVAPVAGDVGLVRVRDPAGDLLPAAGICAGDGLWAVLAEAGLLIGPAEPIAAWSAQRQNTEATAPSAQVAKR